MTGDPIRLSPLPKTWVIDLDGVVLRHNGHLNGGDELLPGALGFWERLPAQDLVVVLTARPESRREETLRFLAEHRLRIDHAIFGVPPGERLLINDVKPSGLRTAYAFNLARDSGLADVRAVVDDAL